MQGIFLSDHYIKWHFDNFKYQQQESFFKDINARRQG
jgi:hypothetical protein